MHMKKYMFFIISVLILLLIVGMVIRRSQVKSTDEAEIKIGSAVFKAEIADTITRQAQGLSGRETLLKDRAMLFIFKDAESRSFWMHGMRFPIDIIWIRDKKVVGFVEEAPVPSSGLLNILPPTFVSPEPADMVLEVNAGIVKEYGIVHGDNVIVVQP